MHVNASPLAGPLLLPVGMAQISWSWCRHRKKKQDEDEEEQEDALKKRAKELI